MSARAPAALAPALVATAGLAAAGGASVNQPAAQPRAALSDDLPPGVALFDLSDATPSDGVRQRCIVLRNSGDRYGRVSMRLARPPEDGGLAAYVEMRVERGAERWPTPGVGCHGFRRARRDAAFFRDARTAFPTKAGRAAPDGGPAVAPGRSRAYRISWSIRPAAAQGAGVSGVDFVWELS